MALLRCAKVEKGLRDAEATVTLEEYDGGPQYLPIDRGMVSSHGGKHYLTVRVLHIDKERGLALVALPVEADSGANRIWVKTAHVQFTEGARP